MTERIVYVGCSLSSAPDDFRTAVTDFKEILRAEGFSVLDFIGPVNGTAEDVYTFDINCVRTCHAFVAICDLPSTGLGQEIQEAIHLRLPALLVAHESVAVSRMVLGAAEVEPNLKFIQYKTLDDIIPQIHALFESSGSETA